MRFKWSGIFGLFLVAQVSLPFISCSNTANNDLTLTGGSTKIIVDQTYSNCVGVAPLRWVLKYKGENVENYNDFIWQKIGDNDPNITITNGYIAWNKPKLVNHTFRIRVSKLIDETGTIIEAYSDEISILADENTAKFEIINSSPLDVSIYTTSHTPGTQNSNWQLYLNGSPYFGSHQNFEVYDGFRNKANAITVGLDGKISWDGSLTQCDKELYLYTKITERGIFEGYTFVSSNPINLHVSNNWLNLSNSATLEGRIEQNKEYKEFQKWSVTNLKSEDITENDTTEWSLVGISESVGISIKKGVISCSKNVPVGKYTFKVKVVDKTQVTPTGEYRFITSDNISIECFQTIKIVSPTTVINGIVNKTSFCSLPWMLKSGTEAIIADNFEIIEYDPRLEGKISISRSLNNELNARDWYQAFIKWDNSLAASDYKFKVAATLNGATYKTEQITLSISNTERIHVVNNLPNLRIYKNDKGGNNTLTDGKAEDAFRIVYNNQYLDLSLVNFVIKDCPENVNLKLFVDGFVGGIVWDKLSKYDGSNFTIKIVASFNVDGAILSDETEFNFTIINTTTILNLYGTSYTHYYGLEESSHYLLCDYLMFLPEWRRKKNNKTWNDNGLSSFPEERKKEGRYQLYFDPKSTYTMVENICRSGYDTHLNFYAESLLKPTSNCFDDCKFFSWKDGTSLDKQNQKISFISDKPAYIPDDWDVEHRIAQVTGKDRRDCLGRSFKSLVQYQTFSLSITVPPLSKVGIDMTIHENVELRNPEAMKYALDRRFFHYTNLHQFKANSNISIPEFISNFEPYDTSVVDRYQAYIDSGDSKLLILNHDYQIKQEENQYTQNCNTKQDLWFENKTSETRTVTLLFGISAGFYMGEMYGGPLLILPAYLFDFSNQTIKSLK